MVVHVRLWIPATICIVAVGLASASRASEADVWRHFAVGQASYQVPEDPFKEEPDAPPAEPAAEQSAEPAGEQPTEPAGEQPAEPAGEQPAQSMPPDPAYQVPLPAPPTRRIPQTAPMVPPDVEAGPIPPPPPTLDKPKADAWQPSFADESCEYGPQAGACGPQYGSPFRRWLSDSCCAGAAACGGGLPMGVQWSGWIAQGVTLNTRSPRDRSNGPVTFNDGSNEYQLNQLYLVAERAVRDDAWSVGGRVDLLYGTDHRYTMARGLEVDRNLNPKWNSEDYGLAMPQVYMEAFAPVGPGVNVKMGHFYTILGYEAVAAPENFFYSHAYTMQYGEPFTHTGVLAATDVGPLKLQAGLTRGWDNWENNNDEYGFLGGIGWTSFDERTSLAFAIHTGREEGQLSPDTNSRTTYSLVFAHNLHGPWSCVVQHDLGIDSQAMGDGSDATWYGLNMYLFREITEHWKFGYRFEWFRDNDGTRVTPGLAADYYQMSWGLNYSPSDRLRIRPSLRWDWVGARGSHLFADGTRDDQLLLDCDVLIMF